MAGGQGHTLSFVVPGHHEQLADHARAFANVLLHELAARDTDKSAVGVVRHRACQQGLAGAGRAVQEHTLRNRANGARMRELGRSAVPGPRRGGKRWAV